MNAVTENTRPNVLLIVMDATRADHLSCYGYVRETSPNVDELACRGVLYEQCISPAVWTLPAMASLFTGLYVSQHGTTFRHQYIDTRFTTIAEVLQNLGYQTALFSTGGWVSENFGFHRGFDTFRNVTAGYAWMRRFFGSVTRVEKLIQRANRRLLAASRGKMTVEIIQDVRRWFGSAYRSGQPFFVVTHFADPHWPFFYHPEFSWRDGQKHPWVFGLGGHTFMTGEQEFSEEYLTTLTDYYDGEISFLDHHVGRFLNWLQRRSYLDNTLVIVTADHGEQLGDHGLMGHGLSVYESLLHVPLILYHPTEFAGGTRVSEPVQTHELFTTILDTLDVDRSVVPYSLPGRSLHPADLKANPWPFTVSEEPAPNLRRFRRIAPDFDTTHLDRQLRALRTREYKFIWSSNGHHELYHLGRDPLETENLVESEPEVVPALQQQLDDWLASLDVAEFDQLEPELDAAVAERLRHLGYL